MPGGVRSGVRFRQGAGEGVGHDCAGWSTEPGVRRSRGPGDHVRMNGVHEGRRIVVRLAVGAGPRDLSAQVYEGMTTPLVGGEATVSTWQEVRRLAESFAVRRGSCRMDPVVRRILDENSSLAHSADRTMTD